MGFESVLPSSLSGIGGASISMDGHGAVSSGGFPSPPSTTNPPSETGNPSLVSPSGADSADFRVEAFPSLPADNISPPPALKFYPPRSVDGDCATILPPPDVIKAGEDCWGATLCGSFFGRTPHFRAVNGIVRRIWARFGLSHVAEIEKDTFLFRFSSVAQMESCLERGPWVISGCPLILQRWIVGSPLSRMLLKSIPLWISLQNVPVEFWTPLGLSWIASAVGKPIQLDPVTAKMERLKFARVCVEVAPDSNFPSKIRIGSSSASPLTVVPTTEILVSYPWKPKRRNSVLPGSVGSPKKPLSAPAPRVSAVPESGIVCATGRNVTMKSHEPGIESSSLVVPGTELQPHRLLGNLEANMPPVSSTDALICGPEEVGAPFGSIIDEPVNVVAKDDQSVEVPSAEVPCCAPFSADVVLPEVAADVEVLASISKDEMLLDQALEQASFLKRVRFAPEILSAEALSSVPHRRMLAPCSDICHPVKFRRSNFGILASEDVPVDDGPNPGADIECHDLSIPPSDGVSPEMEPVSVIDPDITPSPISRILKKYVGSPDRAKKKTRSKLKPCKSK